MKNRTWALLTVSGLLVLLQGQNAFAQTLPGYVRPQVNPSARPTVSPYINLARGGTAGINYYGLVRPQVQNQVTLQQLQQMQLQEAQDLTLLQSGMDAPLPTGTSARYMNFSHYYGGRIANPATMPPVVMPSANYLNNTLRR